MKNEVVMQCDPCFQAACESWKQKYKKQTAKSFGNLYDKLVSKAK